MLRSKYSPEALRGMEMARKFVKLSEKKRPVPADRKYWPALQARFSEFISQAVSGDIDLESGWREWLGFFQTNGGPQLVEEVNGS